MVMLMRCARFKDERPVDTGDRGLGFLLLLRFDVRLEPPGNRARFWSFPLQSLCIAPQDLANNYLFARFDLLAWQVAVADQVIDLLA
jgi:hypothetical protein